MNRLIFVVWGCLVCSCAKDAAEGTLPVPPTVVRTIRVEAGVPVSRTELAPDGYNVRWSPADRIGVYVKSGDRLTTLNAPLVFEGTDPAASGLFSGEITLAEGASEYTLYAYYPYNPDAGSDPSSVLFTLVAMQRQPAAGVSMHLGDYDFLAAGVVSSPSADFPPLTFRHAFAVVEVDLTGLGEMAGKQLSELTLYCTDAATVEPSGALTGVSPMAGEFSFDLTAGAANTTAQYKEGSAQINYAAVRFEEPAGLGATPRKAYVTIAPGDYSRAEGRMYVVLRTVDGYTATYSRPGITIGAAQMKVIRQDVSAGTAPRPTVDLTGDGPRANCYVASLPAQEYSFDATVAGNGVVTPGLQAAVQGFEGRTLATTLTGAHARLLWQSNPHLIDAGSVACRDGKIFFTLTTRPTFLGGNAVIALYADATAAEALWSWHIWITGQTNAELTAAAQTYVLSADYESEYGPGSVQMMDCNLGAIYKEDGPYARSFRAPLFQWGRKDPMAWGVTVFDGQDVPHVYLDFQRPVLSTGAVGQYAGYTGNTAYVTAHPDTFVATSQASSYDWCYGGGQGSGPGFRNNHLWGNPLGYQAGQNTTKTLFDPCPAGWKVPHPYVFSAFTKNGDTAATTSPEALVEGVFVQGWNLRYNGLDATYYPGVGFRYDELGIFAFSPSGYYWSSAPMPDQTFGAMTFGLTSAYLYQRASDPRGFGLPVRCMRDLPTP